MESEAVPVLFIVAGVALCVLEVFTPGLIVLPFGLGAFVAAITGFFGAESLVQCIVFLVASTVFFAALRPISKRLNSDEPNDGIGSRRLMGVEGTVLQDIPPGETGMVRVDREEWRAEADHGSGLAEGTRIRVVDVIGTRVVVEAVHNDQLGSTGGPSL